MTVRAFLVGTAAVTLAITGGCSQSPPRSDSTGHDGVLFGSTTQKIQAGVGTPGTEDETAHPFAVGVCGDGSPGNCQSYCSGALILPNVVATARHCVDHLDEKEVNCDDNKSFDTNNRHGQMWITTQPTMKGSASAPWYAVKSVAVPSDAHVCGFDIALLVLDDLVPASEATPATPGVQYPMGDLNRYLRRFTAIGYGNTGPNGFSAGTRRIKTGISVECIPGDDFRPCPADLLHDNEFFGGDGTCSGDSGSSAFEDKSVQAGKPLSFGVLSRGADNAIRNDAGMVTTPATLCKFSFYTRLDKFRDLVVDTADAASANWTLYPKPKPDWTVYVPPPPDAGVDAGPKKPRDEGVACEDNAECKSKICADTGAGKACTFACTGTDNSTCQEAYVCKNDVCVQDLGGTGTPPPATATSTTTTEGCSTAPGSTGGSRGSSGAAALGLGVGVALALGRRRRPS